MRFVRPLGYLAALGIVVALSAELAARVEDRVRLQVGLFAVPDHDRDLVLHDELGVRGRPNGRFKKWRLNQFGFRSPEVLMTRTPGCLRVMTLGASETLGLFESENHEYPAQISALLGKCDEVLNAGVAGLTLPGIRVFWNNWAVRFSPDVVVIYPTPSFYLANAVPSAPGPPPRPGPSPPWWTPRLLQRAEDVFEFPAFIQRRRVARALQQRHIENAAWNDSAPPDRVQRFSRDLEDLANDVARSGARLVLVTHATGFVGNASQTERDALDAWRQALPRPSGSVLLAFEQLAAEAVREVARRLHLPVVDLAERMHGHPEWFGGDLLHFNDAGAAVAAALIVDGMGSDHESSTGRARDRAVQ